ncbi:MAG TPA: AsmA family protein [Gammaproteobacteria bacterium]|nr:AsmA family protein [Gammaproteobacteria bacterium]
MLKALKILGIVIGAIIAVIIVAAVILWLIINPNDYRDNIEAAVARNTDRTLTIKGDISLSLFPWLGVTVGQATLSNAPGFGPEPFATIDNMQVRVRLLSLIGDHPEVGTLELKGLKLNLERNASGKTNWQDLIGGHNKTNGAGGKSNNTLGNITIDSVVMRDATIDWADAKTDSHYHLRSVNVTVGKVQPNQPFPVKMNFGLDSMRPVMHAEIGLRATATIYPDTKQYKLADGMVEVEARGAGLPAEPTHVKANWQNLQLDRPAGTFNLQALKVHTLGIEADAVLQGTDLNSQPKITGVLTVPDFAPREVLAKMGRKVQPEDKTVLQHASLLADIAATKDSLAFKNVQATLDDTHFTGEFDITNFKTHALSFALTADKFDADRYLPAGREKQAKEVPLGAIDAIHLPGSRLQGLNLHGHLAIGTFKLLNMTASNLAFGINAANGAMTLKPLTAKLYGGTYSGTVQAAAAGKGLKLTTDQTLSAIHFGQLLQDLLGKKLMSGTASLNIAFSGKGDTVGALKQTLDGKVGFKVQHGALEGIDLWSAIRRAYTIVKEHKVPPKTSGGKTEFVAMSGSGVIDNGVLKNKDFKADLPFMHLTGHGSVNLVQRDVDYDLDAKVIGIPKIEGRTDLAKLKGYTIPIHVEGDFTSLTAFPELPDKIKNRLKNEVKSRLDKKKQNLKSKTDDKKHALEDKLKNKLKNLLNSGDDGDNGG